MSTQIDINTLTEMRASIMKWRDHAPNNGIVLTDEQSGRVSGMIWLLGELIKQAGE